MSEERWRVRVTLSTGEVRHLAGSDYPDEAAAAIMVRTLESRREPYHEEWLATVEGTSIARAHIVEAAAVPVA